MGLLATEPMPTPPVRELGLHMGSALVMTVTTPFVTLVMNTARHHVVGLRTLLGVHDATTCAHLHSPNTQLVHIKSARVLGRFHQHTHTHLHLHQ